MHDTYFYLPITLTSTCTLASTTPVLLYKAQTKNPSYSVFIPVNMIRLKYLQLRDEVISYQIDNTSRKTTNTDSTI